MEVKEANKLEDESKPKLASKAFYGDVGASKLEHPTDCNAEAKTTAEDHSAAQPKPAMSVRCE